MMVGSSNKALARLSCSTIHSCAALESSGDSTACSTSSVTSVEEVNDRIDQEIWTDDRHSSYLSSMEEMFVRNLYDKEYCAVDICGEAATRDCVESKPSCSFYEMLSNGYWHPFPSRRLHSWELPPPAAFVSPRTRAKCCSSSTKEPEQGLCRTSSAMELEEEELLWVPDLESTESFSNTSNKTRRVNSSGVCGTCNFSGLSKTFSLLVSPGSKQPLKKRKAHSDTSRYNSRCQSKERTPLDQVVPFGIED